MAKEKIFLICSICLSRNYSIPKPNNSTKRLERNKFCPTCGKHTLHKESK